MKDTNILTSFWKHYSIKHLKADLSPFTYKQFLISCFLFSIITENDYYKIYAYKFKHKLNYFLAQRVIKIIILPNK